MKHDKKHSEPIRKLTIQVNDHLLIPFGCPKWDIEKIRLARVSTEATYFELKFQEDWAYREEYKEATERLEGLGYIEERKRNKNAKETKEESPSMAWFASVTGK